jgi:hypothetical protein
MAAVENKMTELTHLAVALARYDKRILVDAVLPWFETARVLRQAQDSRLLTTRPEI